MTVGTTGHQWAVRGHSAAIAFRASHTQGADSTRVAEGDPAKRSRQHVNQAGGRSLPRVSTDLPESDDRTSAKEDTLHERVTSWIAGVFVGCLLIAVLVFGGHKDSARSELSSVPQTTTGSGAISRRAADPRTKGANKVLPPASGRRQAT